ncbi:MAG: hypothetical protein AMJ94_06250 [Deltaproteobacteria bacterium SM23_61]|nr:MAG: hypothetical protein AMJ94_06250 [Deltaproteobacteria bacterium SM23_61]
MDKRSLGMGLFLLILIFGVGGCCTPKATESLAATLHFQETRMWCWAASGQMVMEYLGTNVAQCTQANNRFGRNDCCNIALCPNPVQNHACVRGGWPEFNRYGFQSIHTTNAALSWEDLKKEISNSCFCGRRPFAFTWRWPGPMGGGHMMVAMGYTTLSLLPLKENFVEIFDPWSPCIGDHRFITYDYYVQSPGHHTHWDDYYKVRR